MDKIIINIDKNSSKEEYCNYLNYIKELERKEKQISEEAHEYKIRLKEALNSRYDIKENINDRMYEINRELNYILRDSVLDLRSVVFINSWKSLHNKKCVNKKHGLKVYREWQSYNIELNDVYLKDYTLYYNRKNRDECDNLYLDFSPLIVSKFIDQKKIKNYFKFLNLAIKLTEYYREKIECRKTNNNGKLTKDRNRYEEIKNSLSEYDQLERFEKINQLDELDKFYQKFLKRILIYKNLEKDFFDKIEDYNKPFKMLLELTKN
jgi:hypothetical protein